MERVEKIQLGLGGFMVFFKGIEQVFKKKKKFADLFCPPQNQYKLAPKVFFKNWDTQAR